MIEFISVNITLTTFLALAFHSHLSLFPLHVFMYVWFYVVHFVGDKKVL